MSHTLSSRHINISAIIYVAIVITLTIIGINIYFGRATVSKAAVSTMSPQYVVPYDGTSRVKGVSYFVSGISDDRVDQQLTKY